MPKVSVITPNYNYARYLPRRLESILDQTFRDFELIVLDDASTDDSRRVIESYLHDPRVRTIFNERNSGNVFKQWNLGLRQASGEYVWIAEADDYAEPTLLETLVERLDCHPNVGLAMCLSRVVDDDRSSGPHARVEDSFGWHEDFIANGRDFCRKYMTKFNYISNASAVLFRRSVLEAVKGAPESLRLCGDYMTYVNVLLISDIACASAYLNYWRCHGATTRSRTPGPAALREARDVQRRLDDQLGLGERDRAFREQLPWQVGRIINEQRRPPYNKVPLGRSLELLLGFARLDPRAFGLALRILGREQAADLARRLRVLGLARALTNTARSRQ
jgi:glycosyltransferase involved in cell wall biosynthesis